MLAPHELEAIVEDKRHLRAMERAEALRASRPVDRHSRLVRKVVQEYVVPLLRQPERSVPRWASHRKVANHSLRRVVPALTQTQHSTRHRCVSTVQSSAKKTQQQQRQQRLCCRQQLLLQFTLESAAASISTDIADGRRTSSCDRRPDTLGQPAAGA